MPTEKSRQGKEKKISCRWSCHIDRWRGKCYWGGRFGLGCKTWPFVNFLSSIIYLFFINIFDLRPFIITFCSNTQFCCTYSRVMSFFYSVRNFAKLKRNYELKTSFFKLLFTKGPGDWTRFQCIVFFMFVSWHQFSEYNLICRQF